MPSYIFLTTEGFTFQPGSESCEPDVENVQMLGIASGTDHADAFHQLVADNSWLLETTFDEVFCHELTPGLGCDRRFFSLVDMRSQLVAPG